ncbi:MAG TPA: hypothetical protein VGU63_00035 [Candidatus Acidoferrales bacterium]|nr:hypothetical protein [Candidatus Acidoferrales bacterium]
MWISMLLISPIMMAQAQDASPANLTKLRTLVVTSEPGSDDVVAVPPATSQMFGRKHPTGVSVNLQAWLETEAALNGLQSTDAHPWHIIITYDQFDEDGDNVHSGTYEEFWAGPKEYKRIYRSDDFNHIDYATDRGLFRTGDQRWPNRFELQVRDEIIAPFSYATTLRDVRAAREERTFSGYNLVCVLIEKNSMRLSDPTQYCFEPDGSVLRYSRGWGWFQTTYNRIVLFQGRNVAQDVEVTDGGKPYLKLHVKTIEPLSNATEADFTPPPDAVGPIGGRISGVVPALIKWPPAQIPDSLRGQRVSVEVEFVIGTNGHVISAHAISGPKEGQKACENSVRKSLWEPYFVLDKPVEVQAKTSCDFQ